MASTMFLDIKGGLNNGDYFTLVMTLQKGATMTITLAQMVYEVVTRGGMVLYTRYTNSWLT